MLKHRWISITFMILFSLSWLFPMTSARADQPQLPPEDIQYLRQLAQATWNGIDYFRSPETGLPYDSNYRSNFTNTTNVGLYLVSAVAAEKMGFIPAEEARERITRILKFLQAYENWNGFFANQMDISGKANRAPEGVSAVSDFNKLPAALLVVRQAYPDLKLASEIFERIDWRTLWDQRQGRVCQGFDVRNRKVVYWGDGWLASDSRMAFFLGIATNAFPAGVYDRLERNRTQQYGLTFFRPNWDFAGLFMHAMEGLFLDERRLEMGSSTADFALAQMIFAEERGYPCWGWSACTMPEGGYTVEGHLMQSVITPHASALAISYYPSKVLANFRALEKLGCRKPWKEKGRELDFGFRDSIDLVTNKVSDLYHPGLDQAMFFIALANYLQDGCIWELYRKDPVVQNGCRLLGKVFTPRTDNPALFAERDQSPLPATFMAPARQNKEIMVDAGDHPNANAFNQARQVLLEKTAPGSVSYQAAWPERNGCAIKLDYDFRAHPEAKAFFVEPLAGLDARPWNAVQFYCRAEALDQATLLLRVRVSDKVYSNNETIVEGIGRESTEVTMPFDHFRGIIADLAHVNALEFGLVRQPGFLPAKRLASQQGSLFLSEIKLVNLTQEELKKVRSERAQSEQIVFGQKGPVRGFADLAGWNCAMDTSAAFTLKRVVLGSPALQVDYNLGPGGKWVGWDKACDEDLSGDFKLAFEYQANGSSNSLEVKLFTSSGAVFGKRIAFKDTKGKWKKATVTSKDAQRLWGGASTDTLGKVWQFGFSVAGGPNTSGKVAIRKLVFERK